MGSDSTSVYVEASSCAQIAIAPVADCVECQENNSSFSSLPSVTERLAYVRTEVGAYVPIERSSALMDFSSVSKVDSEAGSEAGGIIVKLFSSLLASMDADSMYAIVFSAGSGVSIAGVSMEGVDDRALADVSMLSCGVAERALGLKAAKAMTTARKVRIIRFCFML